MFKKIFSRSKNVYPEFKQLEGFHLIPALSNSLNGKTYYTPKLQKIMYSDELVKYMAYLTRKNRIDSKDMRQFTENILTEYGSVYRRAGLEGQQFGIHTNFEIEQDGICPYHGKADYMLYLNQNHFFPVAFFDNELNSATGAALAFSNLVMKQKIRNQPKTSGYSLITNGQEWQLFKLYRNMHLEKTLPYEGRNKFRNLFEDFEMVSVVLGAIDCCLDLNRDDVRVLNQAYDYLDDKKFMIEAKEGENPKANSLMSKVLVNYYEKKKQQNSK